MALLFPLPTHCRDPHRSVPSQIPISLALSCYTPNIGHFLFAKHFAANKLPFSVVCCDAIFHFSQVAAAAAAQLKLMSWLIIHWLCDFIRIGQN